ncbi:MAG TPA: 30S ribosomal protein S9 [Phycisphaerales bacterium]|nr:30S ribosomal protein S9 [Phycisphaerales bacterium]HCD31742.1 30S ribosomal protein S9 [Phycisphaerales bacterium]
MSEEQATPSPEVEVDAAPVVAPEPVQSVSKPQKFGYWWGTGRRKAAVARVRIRPGSGKVQINKRDVDVYFTEPQDQKDVVAPLEATKTNDKIDMFVNVKGGGTTGQAGAIKMGVARALKDYDSSLEAILRENNYLSRDSRRVERKKYGQPGARKRFQFSKR